MATSTTVDRPRKGSVPQPVDEEQPAPQPVEESQSPCQEATPPILLRNTYPPGDPELLAASAPPKVLGKTPTSISQIVAGGLGDKPTHFKGPIVSGGAPGSGLAVGSAILSLALQVDWTMGSFSLPLQFPPDSMVLWATTLVYAAFAGGSGDTTFQLGTGSGRNDILAADGMGPLHAVNIVPVTGALPFAIDPNPGQLWVTVTGKGNTSGIGFIVLLYARGFLKWT